MQSLCMPTWFIYKKNVMQNLFFTWKLFLICAWNVTNLIILFVCNCAMEHKKMLLVFYYNTCHFLFSFHNHSSFYQYYKTAKNTKSFIFMAMFEDVSPHRKTQPSRRTVGQLEIPKKVRVNFSNWFQNNIAFIIESNTFQKP